MFCPEQEEGCELKGGSKLDQVTVKCETALAMSLSKGLDSLGG